jgi:hypothetical protein
MNYTPGPWYPVEYAGYFDVQNGPYYSDTSVSNIEYDENAENNARLMAAAPDILEALIEARTFINSLVIEYPNDYEILTKIDEAINKAIDE